MKNHGSPARGVGLMSGDMQHVINGTGGAALHLDKIGLGGARSLHKRGLTNATANIINLG